MDDVFLIEPQMEDVVVTAGEEKTSGKSDIFMKKGGRIMEEGGEVTNENPASQQVLNAKDIMLRSKKMFPDGVNYENIQS